MDFERIVVVAFAIAFVSPVFIIGVTASGAHMDSVGRSAIVTTVATVASGFTGELDERTAELAIEYGSRLRRRKEDRPLKMLKAC